MSLDASTFWFLKGFQMEYTRIRNFLKSMKGVEESPDTFVVFGHLLVHVWKGEKYFTKTGIKKYKCSCCIKNTIIRSICSFYFNLFQLARNWIVPTGNPTGGHLGLSEKLYVAFYFYNPQRKKLRIRFRNNVLIKDFTLHVIDQFELFFMIYKLAHREIEFCIFRDYWMDHAPEGYEGLLDELLAKQ